MTSNGDIEILKTLAQKFKNKKLRTNTHIYYFEQQENINWEDITIKFKDGYIASVSYESEGKVISKVVDFHTMNMAQYNKEISQSWKLLGKLAEYNGFLKPCNYFDKNLKKQKSLLSKKLKEYFGIEQDPIFWDYIYHGYKTRFKICYKK